MNVFFKSIFVLSVFSIVLSLSAVYSTKVALQNSDPVTLLALLNNDRKFVGIDFKLIKEAGFSGIAVSGDYKKVQAAVKFIEHYDKALEIF